MKPGSDLHVPGLARLMQAECEAIQASISPESSPLLGW